MTLLLEGVFQNIEIFKNTGLHTSFCKLLINKHDLACRNLTEKSLTFREKRWQVAVGEWRGIDKTGG